MTDYKQLCAELEEAYAWCIKEYMTAPAEQDALIQRARAALAQPEPEGPTDEELRELWQESWDTSEEYGAFRFARAVLARWGSQ